MRQSLLVLLVIGVVVIAEGCSSSESSPLSPTGSSNNNATDSIEQVAGTFLDAVRTGNSAVATAQLTPLAQQRMQAAGMDFQLFSSEAASYQLGRVDQISADEAGIDSVWIEPDASGNQQPDRLTLALQRIDGRWYVRGILPDVGPNQPMVSIDFENPDEIASTLSRTASSDSARPKPPAQQATRPTAQDPFRQ